MTKTYANEKGAKAAIRKAKARTSVTIEAVTYPVVEGRVVPTITVTGAPDGALDGFEVVVEKPARAKKGSVVNFAPHKDGLVEKVRPNTKQAAIVEALREGATLVDLRSVCVRRDGTGSWPDSTIISALYHDVKKKGYGIRTEAGDDAEAHRYFLIEPETTAEVEAAA